MYHGVSIELIQRIITELDSSSVGHNAPSPLDDNDELDALLANLTGDHMDMPAVGLSELDAAFGGLSPPKMPGITGDGIHVPIVITAPAQAPVSTGSLPQQTPNPVVVHELQQGQTPATVGELEDNQSGGNQAKTEANSSCELCGYRPKGDPQWFKGSMAKHKKKQHSAAPDVYYSCPFPGCTSRYRNRPDNLRQHQIEKGHFVEEDERATRRPSKRKKVATEEE